VGKYTTFNQKEINYDFDRACQVIILKAWQYTLIGDMSGQCDAPFRFQKRNVHIAAAKTTVLYFFVIHFITYDDHTYTVTKLGTFKAYIDF
jgi:hypothetical protein